MSILRYVEPLGNLRKTSQMPGITELQTKSQLVNSIESFGNSARKSKKISYNTFHRKPYFIRSRKFGPNNLPMIESRRQKGRHPQKSGAYPYSLLLTSHGKCNVLCIFHTCKTHKELFDFNALPVQKTNIVYIHISRVRIKVLKLFQWAQTKLPWAFVIVMKILEFRKRSL